MYGFHLLKIGNLSAEINCEACAVSHQVNVSAQGLPVQCRRTHFIFLLPINPLMFVYWHIHLPWCTDPHRLLREADRVLIDDGWLVISGFNPISLMGLRKLVPVLRKTSPYNSRMFTLMRQLDWLSLLNFEVLHASRFHVLPWNKHGGKLLNAHIPALGCLQLIVARKRTIPLTLNPMKQSKTSHEFARRLEPPGNVVNHRLKLRLDSPYLPVWILSLRHEPVHRNVRFLDDRHGL